MESELPNEIIYINHHKILSKEGELFFFFGMDDYSELVFQLGFFNNSDDLSYLTAVNKLMLDDKFNKYEHTFRIVLPDKEHLKSDINKIITPFGKALFNKKLVQGKTQDFISSIREQHSS